MADDLGGTTQDLLTLHQPHPAEPGTPKPTVDQAEAANRRMGRLFGAVGLTLLITPAITVLLTLVIARAQLELDPVNRFLAYTGYVTCTVLGATFAALFFAERLQRYPRAQVRQLILGGLGARKRIERIEHAIDLIAEHMPESQAIQHWRGFGAAARQVLSETGTDGPPSKSRTWSGHLGLVPRGRESQD